MLILVYIYIYIYTKISITPQHTIHSALRVVQSVYIYSKLPSSGTYEQTNTNNANSQVPHTRNHKNVGLCILKNISSPNHGGN